MRNKESQPVDRLGLQGFRCYLPLLVGGASNRSNAGAALVDQHVAVAGLHRAVSGLETSGPEPDVREWVVSLVRDVEPLNVTVEVPCAASRVTADASDSTRNLALNNVWVPDERSLKRSVVVGRVDDSLITNSAFFRGVVGDFHVCAANEVVARHLGVNDVHETTHRTVNRPSVQEASNITFTLLGKADVFANGVVTLLDLAGTLKRDDERQERSAVFTGVRLFTTTVLDDLDVHLVQEVLGDLRRSLSGWQRVSSARLSEGAVQNDLVIGYLDELRLVFVFPGVNHVTNEVVAVSGNLLAEVVASSGVIQADFLREQHRFTRIVNVLRARRGNSRRSNDTIRASAFRSVDVNPAATSFGRAVSDDGAEVESVSGRERGLLHQRGDAALVAHYLLDFAENAGRVFEEPLIDIWSSHLSSV